MRSSRLEAPARQTEILAVDAGAGRGTHVQIALQIFDQRRRAVHIEVRPLSKGGGFTPFRSSTTAMPKLQVINGLLEKRASGPQSRRRGYSLVNSEPAMPQIVPSCSRLATAGKGG